MAKLYEHMINKRLEEELEGLGGLAPNQYGFMKGNERFRGYCALLRT